MSLTPKKSGQRKNNKNSWTVKRSVRGWCHDPASFEKIIPYIKWSHVPSKDFFRTNLNHELAAPSTGIVIIPLPLEMVPFLARRGLLLGLNGLLPESVLSKQHPAMLELCSFEKTLYALPEDISPYVFASGKGFGRLPLPKRWQQLEKLAGRQKGPILTIAQQGFYNRMGFIFSVLSANGVKLLSDSTDFSGEFPAIAAGYDLLKRFCYKIKAMDPELITHPPGGDFMESFIKGAIPLWGGWITKLTSLPPEKQLEISLFSVPQKDEAGKGRILVRGKAWCIPRNATDTETAVKALLALEKPELVRSMEFKGGYAFPAWREFWSDPALLKIRPLCRYAKELMQNEIITLDFEDYKWRFLDEIISKALAENISSERLILRLRGKDRLSVERGFSDPAISKAVGFIDNNLGSIKKISKVAEAAGMSPGHINIKFKKELRVTIGDYILSRRMERARDLLINTDDPIKAVAFRLGFSSSDYFSKSFKRFWGVSAVSCRQMKKSKK